MSVTELRISLYNNLLTDTFSSFLIKDMVNSFEDTFNWINVFKHKLDYHRFSIKDNVNDYQN